MTTETPTLRQRALDLYKPPFRYDFRGGYIWDANNQMVADNHTDPKDDAVLRVRGWGRIGYLENPEALQDQVGALIAEALSGYWNQAEQVATITAQRDLLLKALKGAIDHFDTWKGAFASDAADAGLPWVAPAREAIAAVEGEQ